MLKCSVAQLLLLIQTAGFGKQALLNLILFRIFFALRQETRRFIACGENTDFEYKGNSNVGLWKTEVKSKISLMEICYALLVSQTMRSEKCIHDVFRKKGQERELNVFFKEKKNTSPAWAVVFSLQYLRSPVVLLGDGLVSFLACSVPGTSKQNILLHKD